MSKAGQSNIRGINAQVRAAMSLYLQHMGDSKFSHIQLEEPRLGDFFLTFNDGHKIICEVKDRKARFSYADLRSLVRDIVRKKILNDNDEILIICKNLDKKLKDDVKNIRYFDKLIRPKFQKKGFRKTEIAELGRVKFWVTSQDVNEKIILYLFTELINFWLPETYIRQILDKILIEKIYEGSAKGQIYRRQDILDEIENLRKTIINDSGYFDQQRVSVETQLTKILEAIKNNEAPEWASNQLASISAQPNLIYFVLAKFRGEKIDNLKDWDGLWKLNKQYRFSFEIFKIFEANCHTETNQDYILKFITSNIPELKGFYREDFFDFEVIDLVNKILDQNKSHLENAFCIAQELLKKYDQSYFYVQKNRDSHYNKERVCKLVERIYTDAPGPLKRKIYDLVVTHFNLVEDEGEFSHYTPTEIFNILYKYLTSDWRRFEFNFIKLCGIFSDQYSKFYKKFGKKVIFDGWELMGGMTSFWGNAYKVEDRHFVKYILIPSLLKYYDKKPQKAWEFIKETCIAEDRKINKTQPDFLNRAVLPIALSRFKQKDEKVSEEAFEILKDFVLRRKGIPHKSELIYQTLQNENFSDEKKWKLVKVSIDRYPTPSNPFVEQIVSDLATMGHSEAKVVFDKWAKTSDYYKKTEFLGSNLTQYIDKLLGNSFDEAVNIFKNYINNDYFIKELDNFDAYNVAGLLSKILRINFEIGLGILKDIKQKATLSTNQQILVSYGMLGSKDEKSDDPTLAGKVYSEFIDPLLTEYSNDIGEIVHKFSHGNAREAFVQFAEKLARNKMIKEAVRIMDVFVNDPDPYLPGEDPEDLEGKYSHHKKIVDEGQDTSVINSVRGWCAWTLAHCVVLDGREYLPKIIDLTVKLSEDADYYVVHMACFPLSRLVHYRLSHMPEDKNTLFFSNDKKVALEMAQKVEKTALHLLDRIIATTPNVQKSLAKSIMSVLGSIRTLKEKDALEFIEKLTKFPDEKTSEITSILLYYAEFRKDSFKDWQWALPGLYDDLHPFNDDEMKAKFKEIMLKNSETKAAFAWEFYRITDSALRKVKHSLDYEEAFSLSIRYMQQLISEYDHRTFETVYRFVEENIEQAGKFELCYDLWFACLKQEKSALESLIKTNNINDIYWWPYHYNGKLLLLVKEKKGNDVFLEILKLLAEYPKEVSIGDVSGAIALLKTFPKTDNRVEQIFSALILRNSNYYHDKQEWMKQ